MKYLLIPTLVFLAPIFGIHAQTLVYEETFTGQSGKGVTGPAPYVINTVGVNWGIDVGTADLTASDDYFQVNTNDEFEATDLDGIVYWTSPSINISAYTAVDIQVETSETGNISNSEFIRFYYIVDNGQEVQFSVNGDLTGDFTYALAESDSIYGNSIQIKIAVRNSAGTKKHFFDNVRVFENVADVASFYDLQDVGSVNFHWSNPASSFDEFLIIGSTSPFSSGSPENDGSAYTANSQWGQGAPLLGGTVLYKGTGTSMTSTGLTLNQIHYARIYVRNDTSWSVGKDIEFLFNPPAVGDLLITEYARHPSISDYSYVEIYNTTVHDINLSGCKILANNLSSTSKIIDFRTEIPEPFIVPANGFLILNRDRSQSNFETTWGVDLSNTGYPVNYNRTGENNFGNQRFFAIKLGGTEDTDDGLLIDETTERPDPGFRVYQVPKGFFDAPESWEDATPGYFTSSENPLLFQLVYAGNSWHGIGGSGTTAPSPSTGNLNAVIRSGNAPFVDGSLLNKLVVGKNGAVDLNTETVTIDSLLLVESGGSIVISSSGEITSNITTTIERKGYSSPSDYNIWGSPFDNPLPILNVFPSANPCDIFVYEAGSQEFVYDFAPGSSYSCNGNTVSFFSGQVLDANEGDADGDFDVARGYFVPGNSNNVRSFSSTSATLNNGSISANIYGSSAPLVDGSNDWNLLSNPYPSAVSADQFLTQNLGTITNAVYVYNPSTGANPSASYSTYNSTDGFNIASCQGFFVDAQTNTDGLVGTVSFTNAMRNDQNQDFRSGMFSKVLFLSATSKNGFTDPTRLYFDELAEWGFDYQFDALKLKNDGMNFGSMIGNQPAVFNGFPDDLPKEIPLYFQHNMGGPVRFSLDSVLGDFSGYQIVLEDRWTNSFYNLEDSPTLAISSGEYKNRFFLLFQNALSTNSLIKNSNVFVYTDSEYLFVQNNGLDHLETVQIIAVDGREILYQKANSNHLRIPVCSFASGMYIVNYSLKSGDNGQQKVIIR